MLTAIQASSLSSNPSQAGAAAHLMDKPQPPQFLPMAAAAAIPPHPLLIAGTGYFVAPLANGAVGGGEGLASVHHMGQLRMPQGGAGAHATVSALPYYNPAEIYQAAALSLNSTPPAGGSGGRGGGGGVAPPITPTLPESRSVHTPVEGSAGGVATRDASASGGPGGSAATVLQSPTSPSPMGGGGGVQHTPGVVKRPPPPPPGPPGPPPLLMESVKVVGEAGSSSSPAATPGALVEDSSSVKMEPARDKLCQHRHRHSSSSRKKSLDASSSKSEESKNPYSLNALIDVPASLAGNSRTSSLSSSLSSFRFGGSLNQLWASQLSLSAKMPNMKSTG